MSRSRVRWVNISKYVLTLLIVLIGCSISIQAIAANDVQKEKCKNEVMEILYNADTSKHSITKYNISVYDFIEQYNEIRFGEGADIWGAYSPYAVFRYTQYNGIVQSIELINVNSDALVRYQKMRNEIDAIMTGIEADMTDLDKVIYLHDSIVKSVSYGGSNDMMYTASGALIDKKAVCAAYAQALNVLLHEVDIEATYVTGTSLNHGWSYVKLDGEWYHVDATWDDTRSPIAGEISRKYLLRNDKELAKDHGDWYVNVYDVPSASSKYSDWFVHDIVGNMCFEDGLWYYIDDNKKMLVANNAEGTTQEFVLDCSKWENVKLIDAEDDKISLLADGKVVSYNIADLKDSGNPQESEKNNIESLNLSDFSNWRTGYYDWQTGLYQAMTSRICLLDYVTFKGKSYKISIDNQYHILIRELDKNKKFLASYELTDGQFYIPSERAEYLAVSLYRYDNQYSIKYNTYKQLFDNGFHIQITEYTEAYSEYKDDSGRYVLEKLPPTDFTKWRSGCYDKNTGAYMKNQNQLCLLDYITFENSKYVARINNDQYHLLVRELDENKKFIRTVNLANGQEYVPSIRTEYLAINIYNYGNEYSVTYKSYDKLFKNGFYAWLEYK